MIGLDFFIEQVEIEEELEVCAVLKSVDVAYISWPFCSNGTLVGSWPTQEFQNPLFLTVSLFLSLVNILKCQVGTYENRNGSNIFIF